MQTKTIKKLLNKKIEELIDSIKEYKNSIIIDGIRVIGIEIIGNIHNIVYI